MYSFFFFLLLVACLIQRVVLCVLRDIVNLNCNTTLTITYMNALSSLLFFYDRISFSTSSISHFSLLLLNYYVTQIYIYIFFLLLLLLLLLKLGCKWMLLIVILLVNKLKHKLSEQIININKYNYSIFVSESFSILLKSQIK